MFRMEVLEDLVEGLQMLCVEIVSLFCSPSIFCVFSGGFFHFILLN